MLEVIGFLVQNGFSEMEEGVYANGKCNVVIQDDLTYAVCNNDGYAMYSDNSNIYWLVGVLTWHGYIEKDYKK